MKRKVVATLKVRSFTCGCGACKNQMFMYRDPAPPLPKLPPIRRRTEAQVMAYYSALVKHGGFAKIDPAEFGIELKDGMRLRVTIEVLKRAPGKGAAS